ncbi:MAG: hypothetical protein AB7T27_00425 [Kiritimatiellia bacterium]
MFKIHHSMNVKLWNLVLLIILVLVSVTFAFPSWMGVFGSYQRHDGDNPGTFMTSMNQDYWGLHAEIGIRVDYGSWNVYTMSYVGYDSGNSVWRHEPDMVFATNKVVEYYFHGWDDWGGNIWDNNGGNNYYFTAGDPVLKFVGNHEQVPATGDLVAGDDLWVNIESWPRGCGYETWLYYSVNSGNWAAVEMSLAGQRVNNDWWHFMLGRYPVNTTIDYAYKVVDGAGTDWWDLNGGSNYHTLMATGQVITYFGNTHHWPTNGALTSADDLWINTESYPYQAGVQGSVIFSIGGFQWLDQALITNGYIGNNEWWHSNLGTMPPGKDVYYHVEMEDGTGILHDDPTSGPPFLAVVAGSATDSDSDGLPDDWEQYWWGGLSNTASANPDNDGVAGLPIVNRLEYEIGTSPAISNANEDTTLLWFPAAPFKGGYLKVSYFVNEYDPLYGESVFVRVDQNDGAGATDYGALSQNAATYRYDKAISISSNAGSNIGLLYHNNAGVTNDNHGLGCWEIPLRSLGVGESADSDSDGLPDDWEEQYDLDPLDDGSIDSDNGADGDPDGDGMNNLQEYNAGANPAHFDPAPEIAITWPQEGMVLP